MNKCFCGSTSLPAFGVISLDLGDSGRCVVVIYYLKIYILIYIYHIIYAYRHIRMCMCIDIYIYTYVCVCVCVYQKSLERRGENSLSLRSGCDWWSGELHGLLPSKTTTQLVRIIWKSFKVSGNCSKAIQQMHLLKKIY